MAKIKVRREGNLLREEECQPLTSEQMNDIKSQFHPSNTANVNIVSYEIYDEDGEEIKVGEVRKTIDGVKKSKPLYEKRIGVTSPSSTAETPVFIDEFISNPEMLMLAQPSYCYYNNTAEDNRQYIPISTEWANEGCSAIPNIQISTGKARLNWKVASYWTNKPCVILLKYTKTTDTWQPV